MRRIIIIALCAATLAACGGGEPESCIVKRAAWIATETHPDGAPLLAEDSLPDAALLAAGQALARADGLNPADVQVSEFAFCAGD